MGRAMHRTMSATAARRHFGQLMRDIVEHDETIIVERVGTPRLAIMSIAEYERLRAGQRETMSTNWLARADRMRERIQHELNGRVLPPADEVIREMREERDEQIVAALRRQYDALGGEHHAPDD